MIIICPQCAAQYGVDPVRFGLRVRTVACSACGWQWETDATDDGAAAGMFAIADDATAAPASGSVPGWPDADPPPPAAADGAAWSAAEESMAAAPEAATDPAERGGPAPADGAASDQWGESVAEGADVRAPRQPPASGPPTPEPLAPEPLTSEPPAFEPSAFEPQVPADRAAEPPAPGVAADAPIAAMTAPPPPAAPRRRWRMMAGGAAAMLVVAVALLIIGEGPITRALPGAAGVYHLVGLAPAPPGVGLEIRELASSREWTGSEDVLIVTGSIANAAGAPRTLPPLRVALFDDDRTEVQTTLIEPAKPVLAVGESVRFTARIVSPAASARRMVVSFDVAGLEHGG
jgi:predicted Zn finger-like uncharacterized protein